MKKLKRTFLKKFNAVLVALLMLFGFSTVLISCEYGAPPREYDEFAIKSDVDFDTALTQKNEE